MRTSINNQAKTFIIKSKEENRYVYSSKDIKLSLKNYLVTNKLLYSPIRWIFILKSSSTSSDKIIDKHIYQIISKLGWVISGSFIVDYFLWDKKKIKEITIINRSKNFISYLWENKKFKINFKLSKINRITERIQIEWVYMEIEMPLSFIVNNFFLYEWNKRFETLILKQDINPGEINNMLLKWFKLSWISKLAIFYKNNNLNWKFKMIENEIIESWKKIDRRNNKINIKKIIKKEQENKINDLDLLFDT